MEAAIHHSDIELDDMEAGSGSALSAHSLNPDCMSLDPESTFQYSFPPPTLPLLPPAQMSSTTFNTNRK